MARQLTPEEIGTALGRLARKIDQWKETKTELLAEAERLAELARGLVGDLRDDAPQAAASLVATTPARARRGGRPKGMKLSEETKAKLRAAWKRRKAAAKKTGRGVSASVAGARKKTPKAPRRGGRPKGMKLSEETKAKLRAAWKRRKAAATAAGAKRTS